MLNDLDGAVREHEVSDMDVTDVPDANAVKSLWPTWCDDFLLHQFDAFGVVPAVEPSTTQSVRPGGQQEVPNPSLTKFDGRFLAGAGH